VFVNAIPVSADNKVCYSTGVAAAYNNGTPYAANGAICATGLASFPLDGFSAADLEVVYSLRRVRTAYGATQPVIRARRSGDDVQTDVFLDSATNLVSLASNTGSVNSGVSLATWAAAGGNSAFIHTDYDHSGNGRNAVQTTLLSQKRLVNAGVLEVRAGGRVGARCNHQTLPTGSVLPNFSYAPTVAGELSLIVVGSVDTNADDGSPWTINAGSSQHWTYDSGGGQIYESLAGTFRPSLGTPAISWPLNRLTCEYIYRQANNIETRMRTTEPRNYASGLVADGTFQTTTGTLSNYGAGHGSNKFGGLVHELILFKRLLTATERDALQTAELAAW
jgi:hypothetical protein